MKELTPVIGALIGGFSYVLAARLRYEEGLNLASIAVATLGAIILLAIFGGARRSRSVRNERPLA